MDESRFGEVKALFQAMAEATALELYGPEDFRLWLVKLDRAEFLARAGGAENLAASRELAGEAVQRLEPQVAPESLALARARPLHRGE